ncbi:quinoprotein relay system zinc metallohydrolase 2 [Rhizobium petrolearium]|uniref:quinoprotein relay system zinc metallohydrolase 2 n=1 Tax=Neorhizobium petrolearium TaxID=515361 RepID=UPI001AE7959C|nr:quinoprotein relay system zinc metallohydrolase 2 [Neorhizobium petrolearium]MBP1843978.1 quinoprotein relay system zinc metallohydrolase 2 [Neorhizobium petrolearium]
MSIDRLNWVDDAGQSAGSARFTRRAALAMGLCLCCVPMRGFAAASLSLKDVGNGLFIREAPHEEATRANNGGIANIGFIIGRDSVLVIDPGGSLADGQWLLSEIRNRTSKPIRHVVMTHVHPDHCLGASAFAEERPDFIGHHALRSALDARGSYYRQRLVEIIGPESVGGIVYPTREIEDVAEVDLGDRIIRFTAHGTAHTDCDLSMFDTSTGTLFPADLLFVDRVPSLDGSLPGWLAEAERLKGVGAARAVPGHGPAMVDFGSAMAKQVRYLTALRDETRKAIAQGIAIDEASRTVAAEEGEGWVLFDDYNDRNVIQAYKELEWE